ncbi:MAG: hypothetical protein D6714_15265 [Bacteroidetes bacterium]|nr:MAG: hypothetical protein D6714_15265 [Bacteroidota bacterium]
MAIDLTIVLLYFAVVLITALTGREGKETTSESYFLSNRNLRWHSVAISTIATNVQGYQFLGMMGSAYLYGLAQANLEINAMQGILMAAFIFVPLYLKDRVVTITQFIRTRLGEKVGVAYSLANLALFSTIGLGAALFWGAYAADLVFADYLSILSEDRLIRIALLIAILGIFSAIYTYAGGLSAVVRTDIIQFAILFTGGVVVLFVSIHHLGGWGALYKKTPQLMHLHLPASHEKLPWTMLFGLFLLNINYWCANQTVMQRSLAARSLKDAQIGLLAGGVLKYFMAVIIVVPGIALAGILGDQPLAEPDQTFPWLVTHYLPVGLRGLILCALFASLMSTVDSTFNSLATLWSIDIYKEYIRPDATDSEVVEAGRKTILFTLLTGVIMGCVLLYVKFNNPQAAFTHTLNELRYYINCGIVVLICAAAFLTLPHPRHTLTAFFITIPLHLLLQNNIPGLNALFQFPEINYFVRAGWVILIAFLVVAIPDILRHGPRNYRSWFHAASPRLARTGWGLLGSLFLLHLIFS